MKGYLVKETCVATQDNPSFAGETRVYLYGKNQQLISASGSPRAWENSNFSSTYLASHYYKRECDARRSYIYKNPENTKFWKSTVEIVEVEI